ncbi:hypothetical protein BDC45DRAFT_497902 [Circinella umbellata]|nr:hypothetical protein BDC45DRAFT_497902 [Circinella umbellata]
MKIVFFYYRFNSIHHVCRFVLKLDLSCCKCTNIIIRYRKHEFFFPCCCYCR